MPDELHPELLPTADPSRVTEPPSTIDATAASASTFDRQVCSLAHDPIAPTMPGYAITGEIARGGMGMVYAAKDLTLKREVAIKTLLPGADAARFITESEITARLPHPGIPPVHALGRLDDGTPYLVMKLIRGRTLADLLKERATPADDLSKFVAIFEQIAQAVGFAHEQGIIHRDLKPLNVMVGAFGEVQVMDWGLAKVLSASRDREDPGPPSDASDLSLTSAGAVMGTPGYMAPEQARGEPADARADVFALGAMLAAILTGKPAFVGTTAKETIEKAANGDLADVHLRLDSCGADADLVVLSKRCLAPMPYDRPTDAEAVAAAVAAYRAGVEARLRQAETDAAAAAIREAEQRKRRRVLFNSALAITLVLGVGLGVSLWQRTVAVAERNAKQSALEAEQIALGKEKDATAQALKRLTQVEKGNEILAGIFEDLDLRRLKQDNVPLETALAKRLVKAAEELVEDAVGDPLVVVQLQNRLGLSLLNLGFAPEATSLMQRASDTANTSLGPDHRETLASKNNLAMGLREAGRIDESLRLQQGIYEIQKAKYGPDHPETLITLNNLAHAMTAVGRHHLALPLFEESRNLHESKLGPRHPNTIVAMNNLAQALQVVGRFDRALPLFEEALELHKSIFGSDHADTLSCMNNLATGLLEAGRHDRAIPLLEENYRIRKAKLGPGHPDTMSTMNDLARSFLAAGEPDRALPLFEEALKLRRAKLGPDHTDTLVSMNNLAAGLYTAGKLDQALPLYEEALKLQTAKFGRDHPNTIAVLNNLAVGMRVAGKLDQALPLLEEALRRRRAMLGPDHPDTLQSLDNLAAGLQAADKLDQALPRFEEAATGMAKLGFRHQHAPAIVSHTTAAYEASKKWDRAEFWRRRWAAAVKEFAGTTSPVYAGELAALGDNLIHQRKLNDAEAVLRECLAIRQNSQPDAWTTFNTQSLLGAALQGQKKYADAEPLLLKGYEGMKAREKSIPQQARTCLPEALDRLIDLYTATNKPDEVKKWKAERAKYPTESKSAATPVKNPPPKK